MARLKSFTITVKPIFAWYDMWIGLFWDSKKKCLYIFPIPMLGLVVRFEREFYNE